MRSNPQVKAALKDRGLNENYGRELMELHTLGVNGGYTQADVTQVAKVFTGWTIDQPARGGEFQFDERKHEPGTKTVLGQKIKENGMNEGLEVLHMLATSPATAKFISTKLAVRFVSDDPPPALVDRMAQAFLASDGDIKTVLRTMFESPEFWAPAGGAGEGEDAAGVCGVGGAGERSDGEQCAWRWCWRWTGWGCRCTGCRRRMATRG